MKSVRCAAVVLLAGLAVGCGGSGDGNSSKKGLANPKHPDVHFRFEFPGGKSSGSVWHQRDDGWVFRGDQGTGEGFGYSVNYDGTTDAGDEYVLNVRLGDDEKTHRVVYEGRETTVELGPDATAVLKPKA